MFLLEQDITKKKQVDKNTTQMEFHTSNKKEYKVEEIWDNAIYARESERHLLELYLLTSWKSYLKKEYT